MALADALRQLATLSPGIVAGLKGDGNAMKAFMESFQQTSAQLDEEDRRKQAMGMQADDRQRMITRQGEADTRALEDRKRAQALQGLEIAPRLAELGATGETPGDAQRIIESAMPSLMEAFGPQTMAMGMPAVQMAEQTITSRQKAEITKFLDSVVNSKWVADYEGADPLLTEELLPPRIQKLMGVKEAKLSDVQRFVERAPVGKPAGRERPPAAVGSFEDYVAKKYGETPTPEQIVEARKVYNQADDRAPKVTVNTGDGIDRNAALKFQDDYARDSKPYLLLRDAYQRVKSAKPDAAGDLSLIFAYMKILDPNSVVREQEFANAQNAAGVPDQIRNLYNRTKEGVRLNPEQRKQFLSQAEALFENARNNQRQVRQTYSNRAKQWNIPENMVLDEDPLMAEQPAPTAKTAAAVGEKRTIKGQLAVWDGKGWKPVQQ